jgi:hypothetical protein
MEPDTTSTLSLQTADAGKNTHHLRPEWDGSRAGPSGGGSARSQPATLCANFNLRGPLNPMVGAHLSDNSEWQAHGRGYGSARRTAGGPGWRSCRDIFAGNGAASAGGGQRKPLLLV